MRWRTLPPLALALCLAACVQSPGEASKGFLNPALASAYIPLDRVDIFVVGHGAATIVAPGVAATNAHNDDLVAESDVISVSRDYDLLFFRTPRKDVSPKATPWVGEMVIAYGQGADGELREARGIVRSLNALVEARCASCSIQRAITFEAGAGEGFSGGPVADLSNGNIVGIVFGYNDQKDGTRLIYAYDMARVEKELSLARTGPSKTAAERP